MSPVAKLLLGGSLDEATLRNAERSTFMLVDEPLRQYSSFFLRLFAATAVATAGIAADSATTIIGAMLIAPLMSPMLGVALAIALGRPRAMLRALALVLLGMGLVIITSMGITAILPIAADMETNTQVLSRVSPRLVDLIIALAASFMAALASMRRDIPDAVPGVAISASIVPPLCVVGAGLYEGAPQAAGGALLLFVTNFVAIQIMGSLVYLLMGLGRREYSSASANARAIWYLTVVVAATVIIAALSSSTGSVLHDAQQERLAQDAVTTWLEGTDYRVVNLDVTNDELYLQIAGSDPTPPLSLLNRRLLKADAGLKSISLSILDEQRIENEP